LKTYQVGGAVRDRLLGLPVHDIDYVVVGSSVKEMLGNGFRPVGSHFPVFLHPQTQHEYALYLKREFGKSLQEHLDPRRPNALSMFLRNVVH